MTAATACRSCGTEPLGNARFCHSCGSPVGMSGARAEYKQVTVLFADVVRSMEIAAAVGAERLREIMTELLDRSVHVVKRYGGTARLVENSTMLGEAEMVHIKGSADAVPARRLMAIARRGGWAVQALGRMVGREWELAARAGMLDRSIGEHGCVAGVVGPGDAECRGGYRDTIRRGNARRLVHNADVAALMGG